MVRTIPASFLLYFKLAEQCNDAGKQTGFLFLEMFKFVVIEDSATVAAEFLVSPSYNRSPAYRAPSYLIILSHIPVKDCLIMQNRYFANNSSANSAIFENIFIPIIFVILPYCEVKCKICFLWKGL